MHRKIAEENGCEPTAKHAADKSYILVCRKSIICHNKLFANCRRIVELQFISYKVKDRHLTRRIALMENTYLGVQETEINRTEFE